MQHPKFGQICRKGNCWSWTRGSLLEKDKFSWKQSSRGTWHLRESWWCSRKLSLKTIISYSIFNHFLKRLIMLNCDKNLIYLNPEGNTLAILTVLWQYKQVSIGGLYSPHRAGFEPTTFYLTVGNNLTLTPPAGVDKDGRLLHLLKLWSVEQVLGLIGERAGDHHKVRFREQGFKSNELSTGFKFWK